jgi:crotonobetainyl-CoA:carnitine CoA-transferase CaiB-like acyl-CoA transferase
MLGAEVIKVEPPGGGDLSRRLGADVALNAKLMGASYLATNGGKRSLKLNLKSTDGIAVLRDLVKSADVLIENFRPGTMSRLKFDYEAARLVKPDLIWCSISGFGQTGPLAGRAAYDQIIQGYCGVMALTGSEVSAPTRVGYQVCDTTAALTAALAISAALYRKRVSGEGEFIDVSMLDASLASMSSWLSSNFLNAGKTPKPMGNENGASCPSGTFKTKNGAINIVANDEHQYQALCDAIAAPELKSDARFVTRPLRVSNREDLKVLLEDKLRVRDTSEWDAIFAAADVPAGPILAFEDAVMHPQIKSRELIKTYDAKAIGRPFSVYRLGFTLGSGMPDVLSPPPQLGEHTDEILGEIGYSPDKINELRTKAVL